MSRRKPPQPPEFRRIESRYWDEAISKFVIRSYCGFSTGLRLHFRRHSRRGVPPAEAGAFDRHSSKRPIRRRATFVAFAPYPCAALSRSGEVREDRCDERSSRGRKARRALEAFRSARADPVQAPPLEIASHDSMPGRHFFISRIRGRLPRPFGLVQAAFLRKRVDSSRLSSSARFAGLRSPGRSSPRQSRGSVSALRG